MTIVRAKEKGNLVVISGPSGAGKGTVINKLLEMNKNLYLSISETSRRIRGQEQNGVEYYFVSQEEFRKRIQDNVYLEYAIYNGNYYGTPKDRINEMLNKGIDVLLEIEIQGAVKVKELIPDALFIFIMPTSLQELKRRIIGRKTETQEKVVERFKRAYQEINEASKYNYVVVNDEVEKAAMKVNSIIHAEKCRVDRIEEIYLNNLEEEIHELLIDKDFNNLEREIG